MPRKRPLGRLDAIAAAATDVFIHRGFAAARIAAIAHTARIGPGTVYLYAESKEALFDLAIRRSLEDPSIWSMAPPLPLPHPTPEPGAVADGFGRCLHNAAQFPQLWLAAESTPPPTRDVREEAAGIIRELYEWLHRYRHAIKLVERCGTEWPDVAQVFHRRFWRGGLRRVADYLGRRMREGKLPARKDPLIAAHLVVESLTWMAVHRHWSPEGRDLPEDAVARMAESMLLAGLTG